MLKFAQLDLRVSTWARPGPNSEKKAMSRKERKRENDRGVEMNTNKEELIRLPKECLGDVDRKSRS